MADLGLATLSDMRAHAEMICNLKPHGPPVIVDMDTGYGVSHRSDLLASISNPPCRVP